MASNNIEVIMPQMGESIAEATITAWRKKVGEPVEEGEPLLDISTAKVEVEIPSPGTGTVAALLFNEGDTVPIDTAIAVLAPVGVKMADFKMDAPRKMEEPKIERREVKVPKPSAPAENARNGNADEATADMNNERRHLIRRRSTPLVRNIAQDLGINLDQVQGTGIHGRVTKKDIESYLAAHAERKVRSIPPPPNAARKSLPREADARIRPGNTIRLDTVSGPFEEEISYEPEYVPVSPMRRMIAEILTRSAQTIPHAYTSHEVDFTHLEKLRIRYKPVFEQQFSTRLTPLVYLVAAVKDALLQFPSVNATWLGDQIQKHKVVNIGIAVSVANGLVVPVLKNVETMSLAGISRGLVDLATRARNNQLKPSDMEGGTFSITSPGQLGATFAIPIILPPQGAIIHLGAIQKVPCVVTGPDGEDCIAIRQRAMLTLGIDHRLIDGWEADQFVVMIKDRIQRADFGLPA